MNGTPGQLDLFAEPDGIDLIADLTRFRQFGEETLVEHADGTPYFINEFWTARQRQAHRLHEISYRACFKPQLPAFFIERLTRPGEIVHDPFMGRGTTPIEAALRGRVPYGNDINPLSHAFVEPRLNPPSLGDIAARLDEIPWATFTDVSHEELTVFYHPETLARIEGLRAWFLDRAESGRLDGIDRWIRMVVINRLTGHSPGFFSVYTLPPNQAASVESQRRINARRDQTPPPRDVPAIIARKSRSLLADGGPSTPASCLLTRPAHATPEIADGSVALTVTSPPFLDVVNYEADNWLRCWFLGVDPARVPISRHRGIDDWQGFIAAMLAELARIARPGGHVAFEVGEVRNGTVRLEQRVIAAAAGLPFEILGVMINQQEFTKTSNCWGRVEQFPRHELQSRRPAAEAVMVSDRDFWRRSSSRSGGMRGFLAEPGNARSAFRGFTQLALAALLALGPGALLGQTVSECDGRARASAIVEPWEENTRTFANGDVRLAVLDTVEPAAGAFNILVLSPPREKYFGTRQCRLVSLSPQIGFAFATLGGMGVAYDPTMGLIFTIPVAVYAPGSELGHRPARLRMTVNQATGEIRATLP